MEVPENAPVSGITVHYKAPGMRIFRAVEMRRMAGGFGLELPCGEVMAPRVEYYLEAFDNEGNQMGLAGSAEQPFSVDVVSVLSGAAPSLPGQPAPTQCTDNECPPGMTCDSAGTAGLGDTCVNTDDCRPGLSCDDNFCIAPDHEDDDDDDDIDNGDMPRFFGNVGFTLGIGYASSGKRADQNDPEPDGRDGSYVMPGQGDCPDEGFDCVRLETAGFVPTYALRFTVGYWIIPHFAVAATVRFQFDAGLGTLSNMLLGLRAQYQLTAPAADGLHADAFLGTSFGQIQLKPSQNGDREPYIISGLNGVQLGANIGYRFTRNVGAVITPEVHLLFPQFLFAIDFTASLSFSF